MKLLQIVPFVFAMLLFSQNNIAEYEQLGETFADVAAKVTKSVVVIESETVIKNPHANQQFDDFFRFFQFDMPEEFRREALGSGVIVREDGVILTNNHVVENAEDIRVVLHDGRKYDAKIIGKDPKSDVAVIQIDEKNLPAISLGDSDKIRVGHWVLAIGSPFSDQLAHTVTHGIVSAKGRSSVGLADYEDFIQTDAAINPGNSGGALVNLHGELVGINTAIFSKTGGNMGIGFAIPINMAKRAMDDLLEYGYVTRAWLGVYIGDINEAIKRSFDLDDYIGAIISGVVEDSPAEKDGLKVEDIIVAVDGERIENSSQLRNIISSHKPKDDVKLLLFRDGREKTIEITLGTLPDDDQKIAANKSEIFEKIGISVIEIGNLSREKYNLNDNQNGLIIVNVKRMGIAERNDIRTGDVILEINSQSVSTKKEFVEIVEDLKSGDNLLFRLQRRESKIFRGFSIP